MLFCLQTITVKETETGVQLAYRKKSASPLAVHPAVSTISIRPRSGPRRAAGVTAKLAKRGYRPDLRAVSNVFTHSFFLSLSLFCCVVFLYLSPLEMHLLEPAGLPKGVMKVGCGHACKITWSGRRSIKPPLDTSHVAIGYRSTLNAVCPTLWHLHLFYTYQSFAYLFSSYFLCSHPLGRRFY